MKKIIISGALCAVAALGGSHAAFAEEVTTTSVKPSQSEMLAQIEQLMKLIADLQAKITDAKSQIQELAADLSVGAEGDDVRKAQEILASDPTVLGVKPTGYFGPLTEAALKKFQERYGLPVTGKLDEATREVMKELRQERKDGMVPPGLIKSEEVKNKIKARLQAKWGDCVWGEKFRASDCKKGHDDKEDVDEEDDSDADTEATKEDAKAAIVDAEKAIVALVKDIDDMEEDDADEDDIDDAKDTLADAKKELMKARRALAKGEYDDAVEAAEKAVTTITGEDDDAEDVDDEDDDSADEDEDDSDDSDEDDDEDDDAEDDD